MEKIRQAHWFSQRQAGLVGLSRLGLVAYELIRRRGGANDLRVIDSSRGTLSNYDSHRKKIDFMANIVYSMQRIQPNLSKAENGLER